MILLRVIVFPIDYSIVSSSSILYYILSIIVSIRSGCKNMKMCSYVSSLSHRINKIDKKLGIHVTTLEILDCYVRHQEGIRESSTLSYYSY